MNKKSASALPGDQMCGQVSSGEETPDYSPELSFDELRNKFDTSAAVARRDITNPASHSSAMRQVVSGKVFKKCKSATFQIDGATYTIGEFEFLIRILVISELSRLTLFLI